jgi:hypothetical protein
MTNEGEKMKSKKAIIVISLVEESEEEANEEIEKEIFEELATMSRVSWQESVEKVTVGED